MQMPVAFAILMCLACRCQQCTHMHVHADAIDEHADAMNRWLIYRVVLSARI